MKTRRFIAYNYLKNTRDYTGAYVLYRELLNMNSIHSKTDEAFSKTVARIVVPNVYEWGDPVFWGKEEMLKVDSDFMNAIDGKSKEIRFKNGAFYGYYCYNVYSKSISWLLALKQKADPQSVPIYECAINCFQARMAYFMKFEGCIN